MARNQSMLLPFPANTLRPSTTTEPLVGERAPVMQRIAVVLPAPLCPSTCEEAGEKSGDQM